MSAPLTILWVRNDRRVDDNPALASAASGPVIPLFVWSPDDDGEWAPGAASRWWLHRSLAAFAGELESLGSRLVVRIGPIVDTIAELVAHTGATRVVWNRHHEPLARSVEADLTRRLESEGVSAHDVEGQLLVSPRDVRTTEGSPYKVFTPFWKALAARTPDAPVPAPAHLRGPDVWPESTPIEHLALLPERDWANGFTDRWTPGAPGASRALETFLEGPVGGYGEERDRPDRRATSRLSPHLHGGEIGVRRLFRLASGAAGSEPFLRQIAWREFSHHLIHHFPSTTTEPLRAAWTAFPWRDDRRLLRAWQRGRTGYPIVDAGMRELWATGWMHNRVRLIAGSFLVKDLLVHWLEGARWFWDTLVDADLANNTLGWQWIAGTGADAAPYFRIFNPITQGKRFDPDGAYVRRWVPELSRLPRATIHEPWTAAPLDLASAGVRLGETYPEPIVDHAAARTRALEAYERVRS